MRGNGGAFDPARRAATEPGAMRDRPFWKYEQDHFSLALVLR